MSLTSEQRDTIATELKSLVSSLNLSDDQKQRLQGFMTEASEKVQEYKQQNPNASSEDLLKKVAENRTAIRQRLVNFLTPDQLSKWDAEISKAKEFLGQKLAA
jgi:periplasmic protein CpxP/Spy